MIDSGVDGNHPDLAGNVLKGKDFIKTGDGQAAANGHGTAMASLIAGHGHGPQNGDGVLGLAPATKILPVRTNTSTEPMRPGQERTAEAIRWAVDNGAKVINMSISSTDPEQRDAITYALDRDVVIVAAAGNTTQHDRRVLAPARYPGVIAVSGTDRDGNFTDASMEGKEVVLAAPAVDITAAGASKSVTYTTGTGTSAAAALVSAAAALIRSHHPQLNAASVIQRLIATADDRGPKGRDPEYGYGVVAPLKAVSADVPTVERNPLLPDASRTTATSAATDSTASAVSRSDSSTPSILIAIAIAVGLAVAGIAFGLAMRTRYASTPQRAQDPVPNPHVVPPPDERRPEHPGPGNAIRPGAPEP